jgi:hypothetical protein
VSSALFASNAVGTGEGEEDEEEEEDEEDELDRVIVRVTVGSRGSA